MNDIVFGVLDSASFHKQQAYRGNAPMSQLYLRAMMCQGEEQSQRMGIKNQRLLAG